MRIDIHAVIMTAVVAMMQVTPAAADDFDDFISSASAEFDSFIDDANRDFINFMRSPWAEIKAQPPKELRALPEIDAPVLYLPDEPAGLVPPDNISIVVPADLDPAPGLPADDAPREGDVAEERVEDPASATGDRSGDEDKVRELLAQNKPGDSSQLSNPKDIKTITPAATVPVKQPEQSATPSQTKVDPADKRPAKPMAGSTMPVPADSTSGTGDTGAAASGTPASPAVKSQDTTVPAPVSKSNPLYDGGDNRVAVEYCGMTYYVDSSLKNAVKLSKIDEKNIADAYELLFRKNYSPLLADLKTLRSDNLGNDWALFMLVRKLSESFVGKNEAVVMRQFLLNQLGFKTRIARKVSPQGLALYVATDKELFQHPYIERGGLRYYDTDSKELYRFTMCDADAPAAKAPIAMALKKLPDMASARVKSSRRSAVSGVGVEVTLPRQLVEFYSNMPQCDYSVYTDAPVDRTFSGALLSSLGGAVSGKSKVESAGILLDFVQNGFEYATDREQFGYEKPFFVEELFYYPSCDCEDRSILYRYIVKNILGLDCILINYPNHIATAVDFGQESVSGDAVTYQGRKYIVCDPTFINAPVGMAMPDYRNIVPTVVR